MKINKDIIKLAQIPLEISDNFEELLFKLREEKKTFTDDIETLKAISNSLISGKHIVLYGPIGTGKTKLAREIAKIFNVDIEIANVGETWESPDELIGYKTLSQGEIKFNKGYLLKALERCYQNLIKELTSPYTLENSKQACWLILDEMNRGNINRYLSSLITALEPLRGNITQKDFEEIYKISVDTGKEIIEIPIPLRFRIIGTINTFDMNFLYSFASALEGRRINFISVNPPRNVNYEIEIILNILLNEFPQANKKILESLMEELKSLIENLRNRGLIIGTALFIDIGREVLNYYNLFELTEGKEEVLNVLDKVSSVILPPIIRKLTFDMRQQVIDFFESKGLNKTLNEVNTLLSDVIEEIE